VADLAGETDPARIVAQIDSMIAGARELLAQVAAPQGRAACEGSLLSLEAVRYYITGEVTGG
jgi:hypothetical protein